MVRFNRCQAWPDAAGALDAALAVAGGAVGERQRPFERIEDGRRR